MMKHSILEPGSRLGWAQGEESMHPNPNRLPSTEDDSDSSVDLTAMSTSTHAVSNTPPPVVPVSSPRHPADPAPGTKLGQYLLLRELGSGGMGVVYEAEDQWLNRRVALKVLRSDLPSEHVERERFLREARAMAAIQHENVCTIYQVGEADGRPYMAMQFLLGETLETRLEREHRLPTADAARIGHEMAAGLFAAHAKGLVHRDVKPANVWLEGGSGRVKLLDFGLALARDNVKLTHSGFVIGTPAFMSPEQARGEPLDGRSDLFSLGIVLYLATSGDRPFDGVTAMAVMRNLEMHYPSRVNVKRVDVPAALSNLIMELLAKDPKDRPSSADIVAARLARPEMTRPTHLPVAPPPTPSGPPAPALPRSPGWETPPRNPDPGPTRSFIRILFLLAVASVGFALYWHFHVTNYGKIIIDPELYEAEVDIRQQGKLKHSSVRDREFEVRPGSYDLVLVKPKIGYKLTRSIVKVERGGREKIGVVRDLPGP